MVGMEDMLCYVPGWVWWYIYASLLCYPGILVVYTCLPTMLPPCIPGYTMVSTYTPVLHILLLMVVGCAVTRLWAQEGRITMGESFPETQRVLRCYERREASARCYSALPVINEWMIG